MALHRGRMADQPAPSPMTRRQAVTLVQSVSPCFIAVTNQQNIVESFNARPLRSAASRAAATATSPHGCHPHHRRRAGCDGHGLGGSPVRGDDPQPAVGDARRHRHHQHVVRHGQHQHLRQQHHLQLATGRAFISGAVAQTLRGHAGSARWSPCPTAASLLIGEPETRGHRGSRNRRARALQDSGHQPPLHQPLVRQGRTHAVGAGAAEHHHPPRN